MIPSQLSNFVAF